MGTTPSSMCTEAPVWPARSVASRNFCSRGAACREGSRTPPPSVSQSLCHASFHSSDDRWQCFTRCTMSSPNEGTPIIAPGYAGVPYGAAGKGPAAAADGMAPQAPTACSCASGMVPMVWKAVMEPSMPGGPTSQRLPDAGTTVLGAGAKTAAPASPQEADPCRGPGALPIRDRIFGLKPGRCWCETRNLCKKAISCLLGSRRPLPSLSHQIRHASRHSR
mmetsp:Transcript_10549/g.30984  ORF Transcript_10549/g.30984 Transcript_10549/m.30984 type:complete len:220 (-) Transcript_10549:289-948(-)